MMQFINNVTWTIILGNFVSDAMNVPVPLAIETALISVATESCMLIK
jgi:hypothetical protein